MRWWWSWRWNLLLALEKLPSYLWYSPKLLTIKKELYFHHECTIPVILFCRYYRDVLKVDILQDRFSFTPAHMPLKSTPPGLRESLSLIT